MIEAVNGSLHRDSRRDYPGVARWPSGQGAGLAINGSQI